jgi:cell wall-associated NlpC family hydrolase
MVRKLSWVILVAALGVLGGCATGPEESAYQGSLNSEQIGKMINYAMGMQGVPYVWGGNTPDEGFDCSGLVKNVYSEFGVPLPRTAAQMANALPPVPPNDLRAGDLLFFNTMRRHYSHVGLYLGDNRFLHASSRGGEVMISDLQLPYWQRTFEGVRRP